LVTSAIAGERGAFAELVRRHTPIAHRTAVLLGAGADADDVVQEAFVKAYRSLGRFRVGAPFRPWLLRIVANQTSNLLRSARRRRMREQAHDLLPAIADDPADSVINRDRRQHLRGAVEQLPTALRLVVTCRYLLELDEEETAQVLGVARGTVKSRTHRALAKLRAAGGAP
jgi:RNA polymerase sigma-70 factor (ECF subfamily)